MVELPYTRGIRLECTIRCKAHRVIFSPQTPRSSECRDTWSPLDTDLSTGNVEKGEIYRRPRKVQHQQLRRYVSTMTVILGMLPCPGTHRSSSYVLMEAILDRSANRGCGCSRKRCDLQCTWAGPGEEHQNGPSIATELECQSRLLLSLTFSIK